MSGKAGGQLATCKIKCFESTFPISNEKLHRTIRDLDLHHLIFKQKRGTLKSPDDLLLQSENVPKDLSGSEAAFGG